jgi:hypothetical protein
MPSQWESDKPMVSVAYCGLTSLAARPAIPIKKMLPPVNWRWVTEGDGYVRHEAWPHTPTVWECGLRRSRTWAVLTLLLTFPDTAISWS